MPPINKRNKPNAKKDVIEGKFIQSDLGNVRKPSKAEQLDQAMYSRQAELLAEEEGK